jgi:hypothetical protein
MLRVKLRGACPGAKVARPLQRGFAAQANVKAWSAVAATSAEDISRNKKQRMKPIFSLHELIEAAVSGSLNAA